MKDASATRVNRDVGSLHPFDESAWTSRGLPKSGRDYDEVECQRAVAGYMAEHLDRTAFPDDIAQ